MTILNGDSGGETHWPLLGSLIHLIDQYGFEYNLLDKGFWFVHGPSRYRRQCEARCSVVYLLNVLKDLAPVRFSTINKFTLGK